MMLARLLPVLALSLVPLALAGRRPGADEVALRHAEAQAAEATLRHADARAQFATAPDTLAPLAPPGAPPDSFPAPDRPVAKITTDTWSNEKARDEAKEAERVLKLLGVTAGMSVADVGAGSGYYTVRLSRAVGPTGRVYAEDIIPRYLEKLGERVRLEGLSNVALALGEPHDPRLPAASLDLALMVHMYHEVEQPYGLLYNLARSLRPGARVAVIDLDKPTSSHGTPPALLRCELAAVGYRQIALHELGAGSGYLAVFEPPAYAAALPRPHDMRACAA
jgi:predicted methyltransferase